MNIKIIVDLGFDFPLDGLSGPVSSKETQV
jgi:hypothetical protein